MAPLNDEVFACAVTGKPGPSGGAEFLKALTAAVFVELILAGRIEVAEDGDLVVRDAAPTGDEVADRVLAELPAAMDQYEQAGQGRTLASMLPYYEREAYKGTYDRAIATGLVEARTDKLLGLVSREVLELTPAGEEIRSRARAVLLGEAQPDRREAALVLLLAVGKLVDRQVPKESRKAARARAEELSSGDPVAAEIAESIRRGKLAVAGMLPG